MTNYLNEEEAMVIGATTALLSATAALLKNHNYRDTNNEIRPYVNTDVDRENYINSVLFCGDTHYLNQIRMRTWSFLKLCEMLERKAILVNMIRKNVREQVLIFCHLLGHNVSGIGPNDQIMREVDQGFSHDIQRSLLSQKEKREENQSWQTNSDAIANALCNGYDIKEVQCQMHHSQTSKPFWLWVGRKYEADSNVSRCVQHFIEVDPTHDTYLNNKIDMQNGYCGWKGYHSRKWCQVI
ncbi:hypothetical protein Cgig2_006640 [Carnegiea gigantea]|uniref:DUF8040 domain-containing protein n=1 Tax=Carnegiea gigantea TaxID=171969 RepID=A0A9Q1GML8_9CARY|nr:hypothetical protein Cgig2_006640 [Carnegiea gigantea]